MKKILSLAVLTLLIWNQSSFANNWFPQVPNKTDENTVPKNEMPDNLPKTLPPNTNQSLGVFLKAPCGTFEEMRGTVMKYKEELLFNGTGLTFSPQNQPYNGAMLFFTNQDTGSWTLLQVFPDGMACMIMNGKNFQPYMGDQPYGDKK